MQVMRLWPPNLDLMASGSRFSGSFYLFIFKMFYFILEYSQLTMLCVSGGQQRDSAIHIHISILPQTPLPSRLLHNIEQGSMCSTVGPCGLSKWGHFSEINKGDAINRYAGATDLNQNCLCTQAIWSPWC